MKGLQPPTTQKPPISTASSILRINPEVTIEPLVVLPYRVFCEFVSAANVHPAESQEARNLRGVQNRLRMSLGRLNQKKVPVTLLKAPGQATSQAKPNAHGVLEEIRQFEKKRGGFGRAYPTVLGWTRPGVIED